MAHYRKGYCRQYSCLMSGTGNVWIIRYRKLHEVGQGIVAKKRATNDKMQATIGKDLGLRDFKQNSLVTSSARMSS